MVLPRKLAAILEEHELEVKKGRERIVGKHPRLPIVLDILELEDKKTVITLQPLDDLREALEEALENDEDIDTLIDDVLSELRDIALEAKKLLEEKGYTVELELIEGENDIREILDEVKELHETYAEEASEYYEEE